MTPPDAMTSEDGGMSMMPDATGGQCVCDTTFSCDSGCPCDPECPRPPPDAGGCACDTFAHCQTGCACDTDCPCACDSTVICDPAPSGSTDAFCSCDPECYEGNGGGTIPRASSSCATTGAADTWASLGVLLAALAWRRRRRAA
jgi:MYXO-CTERM domain-containing protein